MVVLLVSSSPPPLLALLLALDLIQARKKVGQTIAVGDNTVGGGGGLSVMNQPLRNTGGKSRSSSGKSVCSNQKGRQRREGSSSSNRCESESIETEVEQNDGRTRAAATMARNAVHCKSVHKREKESLHS